jgi:DNA polymerase III subunit gamma/tau
VDKKKLDKANAEVTASLQATQAWPVKYRPKKFTSVMGQEPVIAKLNGMLKSRQIPSALLFCGGSGLGKTTLGRIFAYHVNCTTFDRCGKCDSCKTPFSLHPDIKELNMADTRGIDDVRALIANAKYKPRHQYLVIISDEVHNGTPQAMQLLLKTLEEPPPNTMWILSTTNPEKLPHALKARCIVLPMNRVLPETIVPRLKYVAEKEGEKYLLDDKLLTRIAEASGGHVRDAVALLEGVSHYVRGKGGPKKIKNIDEALADVVFSSAESSDDKHAIKVLLSVYTGKVKTLHRSLLEVQNYVGFAMKLIYLQSYVVDRTMVPEKHPLIWWGPDKEELMKGIKHYQPELLKETQIKRHIALLGKLNELRARVHTFSMNERALYMAGLTDAMRLYKD